MINKRQIGRNAIVAILQILVNGVILFFLYRFFLQAIGAEQFGIWALVMAFTSFASVANLGFAGSVVKFVAQSQAKNDEEKTSHIIQTSAITIAVISGLLMIVLFPIVRWGLQFFISVSALPTAVMLLPYSFVSLWLMMIAGIFLSALDGYKRTDIRGIIMIGVCASNFVLCVVLVPKFNLLGIAYSIVFSNCLALIAGWVLIKGRNPLLPFLPCRWRKSIFKEIIGYATKLQIVTLAVIFFEPVTKAFLSKFGGLSIVAYYEMASRLVLQIRALIVSSYQVLIPVFAEAVEKRPENIPAMYTKSYELVYYLSILVYGLIGIWLLSFSWFWIGYVHDAFVIIGFLLISSWFVNTLAVPAYVVSLGTGNLKWYIVGNLTISFLNIVLGYNLGKYYGWYGVVAGYTVAMIVGSLLIAGSVHIKSTKSIIPHQSLFITGGTIIGLVFIYLLRANIRLTDVNQLFLSILLSMLLIALAFFHPLRKELFSWLHIRIL